MDLKKLTLLEKVIEQVDAYFEHWDDVNLSNQGSTL
ncbi:hypothetical protein AALP_AA6G253800 [Arabis alpina]|uniref:Uncharacterized protein n=1 Tax=Arabis alpina TaxID=50452 RepID=A0A087GRM0_ARAAL|nr:hypothetical protein AALP_AA6G253800 [Arabis alpina]